MLTEPFASLEGSVAAAVADFRLRDAARLVTDAVAALNADLTATEPWRLARDPATRQELVRVLARQVAAARAIAAAAEAIVPDLARRLRERLGVGGQPLPLPTPAFRRLDPS